MSEEKAEKEADIRAKKLLNYLGQTRPAAWFRSQWDSHPARLVGLVLLAGAVVFFIMDWLPGKFFEDFSANFATEMLSIAITVLLIDALNTRQRNQELKAQLIRQMGSRYPDVAVTATNEMRYHGWGFGGDNSLVGASLRQANLEGAQLEGINLKEASLSYANLKGANLRNANLKGAWLEEANLEGIWLEWVNLEEAYLRRANLIEARLSNANLKGADLRNANLKGAWLNGANLEGAWLDMVNLEEARLDMVNLEEARLDRANLEGALLAGAKGVTPQQLKETQTLFRVMMPDFSTTEEWALTLFDKSEIDKETFSALNRLARVTLDEEE